MNLSQTRQEHLYRAIQSVQSQHGFSVNLLCELLQVPRSSYYKRLNRKESPREKVNRELLDTMLLLYEKVEGISGYRQLTIHLTRQIGYPANHKRIYRLMKIAGIKAVIRRKRKSYIRSTPQHIAENLLNRQFTAQAANEKWVTDVTEFKYGNGQKAYLSAILDLYDKSIVSYVVGHSNNNPLVFRTLELALKATPGATPLLHSDRGFQYTSLRFKKRITSNGLTQSMSRVGKCIDNGPMEGFWGTLKCEKYYLHKYHTFQDLKNAIEQYIYFYNYERLQKKLNSLSPMEFRTKTA